MQDQQDVPSVNHAVICWQLCGVSAEPKVTRIQQRFVLCLLTSAKVRSLFVLKQISKKITQFSTPKRFGPDKCPVYLRASYTGKASLALEKNVRTAVENCYGSVTVRTAFVSRKMLPASRKDVLPANQKSFVIYEYKVNIFILIHIIEGTQNNTTQ